MAKSDSAGAGEPAIHIVEDDEAVRDALAILLRMRGFRVEAYPSAIHFLDALPGLERGCIVTDVTMPQMSGIELMRRLREAGVDWPVIVISGRSTHQMAAEAAALGAAAVIAKPLDPPEIVAALRRFSAGAQE